MSVAVDQTGIRCLEVSTEALALRNDYNLAARGIQAPDPAPYIQRRDALRAEHSRLGCPGGTLLLGFP